MSALGAVIGALVAATGAVIGGLPSFVLFLIAMIFGWAARSSFGLIVLVMLIIALPVAVVVLGAGLLTSWDEEVMQIVGMLTAVVWGIAFTFIVERSGAK